MSCRGFSDSVSSDENQITLQVEICKSIDCSAMHGLAWTFHFKAVTKAHI